MPFKQLSLRKQDAALEDDPYKPLDPYLPVVPLTIGELAMVSQHDGWDGPHLDSLSFYVGQSSIGIKCARSNDKQTTDGATFEFTKSANVFISPRDDYCFVRAQNIATVGVDGWYRSLWPARPTLRKKSKSRSTSSPSRSHR